MKFLCVACDEPMKLMRAEPPNGGSISALYGCPTCSNQIAMLTNPMETQVVQSLGVQIGPAGEEQASGCPFSGMLQEMEAKKDDSVQWTDEALARLERIPEFVRPMARQGIEHFAQSNGHAVIDEAILEEARDRFGM